MSRRRRGDRQRLPSVFEADRALLRGELVAELAVIIDVESRGVGQAERGRRASVEAVAALSDAGHHEALPAQADLDRSQVLIEIVDEFAVGGQVQNLLVEDEVTPNLGAEHEA